MLLVVEAVVVVVEVVVRDLGDSKKTSGVVFWIRVLQPTQFSFFCVEPEKQNKGEHKKQPVGNPMKL